MYKVFSAILICIIFLTSCSNKIDSSSDTKYSKEESDRYINKHINDSEVLKKYNINGDGTVINFFDTMDTVYKKDVNYIVNTDGFSFCYKVNDNDGNLLDIGYHDYQGGLNFYYQEDLLVLEYGYGGNLRPSKRYYDVKNGRVSRFFDNPIAEYSTKVAYFTYSESKNENILIVRDMFDMTNYYTEIKRNFANGTELYYNTQAAFLENGKKLEITYPVKSKNAQTTAEYKKEIFELK